MAEIKTFTQPLSLYRYRSLGDDKKLENEINAISNNYLWSSAFDQLNDPMEGSYFPSSLLKKSPRFEDIKNKIKDQKAGIGICSFSETHDNDLMWAHYADQFAGICIGYKVNLLLKALPDNVDLVRLFYNEKVPTYRLDKKSDDFIIKKILSSKNYRWLYEREWRLLANDKSEVFLRHNCISCVYLGKRINKEPKRQLLKVLNTKNIPYKTMSIDGYSIKFITPKRA